jgi:hypothetical protein
MEDKNEKAKYFLSLSVIHPDYFFDWGRESLGPVDLPKTGQTVAMLKGTLVIYNPSG